MWNPVSLLHNLSFWNQAGFKWKEYHKETVASTSTGCENRLFALDKAIGDGVKRASDGAEKGEGERGRGRGKIIRNLSPSPFSCLPLPLPFLPFLPLSPSPFSAPSHPLKTKHCPSFFLSRRGSGRGRKWKREWKRKWKRQLKRQLKSQNNQQTARKH